MDAKLLYWTGAMVNMAVVVGLAARGVRRVRRDDVSAHRRSMGAAALLVGLFVASYVVKLVALGHEDRSLWTPGDRVTLYVHETCVLFMLLGGAGAGAHAWRMRATRRVTGDPADPAPRGSTLRWHRRLGWLSVASAVLGLVTAAGVLWRMYVRAGLT